DVSARALTFANNTRRLPWKWNLKQRSCYDDGACHDRVADLARSRDHAACPRHCRIPEPACPRRGPSPQASQRMSTCPTSPRSRVDKSGDRYASPVPRVFYAVSVQKRWSQNRKVGKNSGALMSVETLTARQRSASAARAASASLAYFDGVAAQQQ